MLIHSGENLSVTKDAVTRAHNILISRYICVSASRNVATPASELLILRNTSTPIWEKRVSIARNVVTPAHELMTSNSKSRLKLWNRILKSLIKV